MSYFTHNYLRLSLSSHKYDRNNFQILSFAMISLFTQLLPQICRAKLKILNRVFAQVIPIKRFITHQLFVRHDDFPWNRRILQIFFLVA